MKLEDIIRKTNLEVKDYTPIDVDEQWKIFQGRVAIASDDSRTTKPLMLFSINSLMKAAALIAIVVSVYLIAKPSQKIASTTTLANTENIKMIDNSIIYLDSFSTVTYPMILENATSRNLYLTGNAIFEVAPDPLLPFIVECGDIQVKAVGTTFSIDQTHDQIEIKGIQGIIDVSHKDHSIKPIRLNPGQKLQYQDGLFTPVLEPIGVTPPKNEIVEEVKPNQPTSPQPDIKTQKKARIYKARDIVALLQRRYPGKIKSARKIKSDRTTTIKVEVDKDLQYLLNKLTELTPYKVKQGKCQDCFEIYRD